MHTFDTLLHQTIINVFKLVIHQITNANPLLYMTFKDLKYSLKLNEQLH